MGMDLDPSGRLLVADTYANRVLRLDPRRLATGRSGAARWRPRWMLSLGVGGELQPRSPPGVARTYTASLGRRRGLDRGRRDAGGERPESNASGHLVNGAYTLAQPLLRRGRPAAGHRQDVDGAASHDPVTIALPQTIGANEPLRTGTYAKTLTFSLSTTQP